MATQPTAFVCDGNDPPTSPKATTPRSLKKMQVAYFMQYASSLGLAESAPEPARPGNQACRAAARSCRRHCDSSAASCTVPRLAYESNCQVEQSRPGAGGTVTCQGPAPSLRPSRVVNTRRALHSGSLADSEAQRRPRAPTRAAATPCASLRAALPLLVARTRRLQRTSVTVCAAGARRLPGRAGPPRRADQVYSESFPASRAGPALPRNLKNSSGLQQAIALPCSPARPPP